MRDLHFQVMTAAASILLRLPGGRKQLTAGRQLTIIIQRRSLGRVLQGSRKANTDVQEIAKQIAKAESKSVLVMAGAGLSTPSGIPDFRSPGMIIS